MRAWRDDEFKKQRRLFARYGSRKHLSNHTEYQGIKPAVPVERLLLDDMQWFWTDAIGGEVYGTRESVNATALLKEGIDLGSNCSFNSSKKLLIY